MEKARRGVALVIKGMDKAPDEYRRAFAFCLVLARLSEVARTPAAKAMLQAAAGLDMKAADLPAFLQAELAEMREREALAATRAERSPPR